MPLTLALQKVRHTLLRIPYGYATVLSAVLAVPAITYPVVWFLAPCALALSFFELIRATSWKHAFVSSLVFGLAVGGAGVWWFWDTLPLDWLGFSAKGKQWYYAFASWGSVSFVFGLASALVMTLVWRVRASRLAPLVFAFAWVVAEDAKMWAFSLLTYGERSLMGPHFSSSALGYPLAEQSYLLQIAEGGGLYFLNLTVALIASLVAFSILRPIRNDQKNYRLSLVALFLIALLLYPLIQKPRTYEGEPLTFGVYTSDFDVAGSQRNSTEEYLKALASVKETVPDVDVIMLPEEIRLEAAFASPEERETEHAALFGDRNVLIMSSNHLLTPDNFSLVLSYDTTDGTSLGTYSKRFLMPAGEYMPYFLQAAFSLAPDPAMRRHEKTLVRRALPGSDVVTVPYKGWNVSGLVCSDFLSPHFYQIARARDNADLLINLANPSWFHHSRSLYDKTLQISKVHAVQNRAYFLQSSNGGRSFALRPDGSVIVESPWHFIGTVPVTIPQP